jgi:hypothetical protein
MREVQLTNILIISPKSDMHSGKKSTNHHHTNIELPLLRTTLETAHMAEPEVTQNYPFTVELFGGELSSSVQVWTERSEFVTPRIRAQNDAYIRVRSWIELYSCRSSHQIEISVS